jgi:hypothetical protein
MKKLLSLLLFAGIVAFVACGPSKEQQKKKAYQDSLRIDSLVKDGLKKAEQKRKDSIKKADSIVEANTPKKNGKPILKFSVIKSLLLGAGKESEIERVLGKCDKKYEVISGRLPNIYLFWNTAIDDVDNSLRHVRVIWECNSKSGCEVIDVSSYKPGEEIKVGLQYIKSPM